MMRRIVLWLAEAADRWARRITGDDLADRLAAAESVIDCWAVDRGALLLPVRARVVVLDDYR